MINVMLNTVRYTVVKEFFFGIAVAKFKNWADLTGICKCLRCTSVCLSMKEAEQEVGLWPGPGNPANEIKGSRSMGVTKARVGGRCEFSEVSVLWIAFGSILLKSCLDQDGRLWILENNTERRKSKQQNVKNCWMGKWPYFREKNQKRLYLARFFSVESMAWNSQVLCLFASVLLASTCDTLQQNSF